MSITLLTFFLALLAGILIAPSAGFSNNFFLVSGCVWFAFSIIFLAFAFLNKMFEKAFSVWLIPGAFLLGIFIHNPFPDKISPPEYCNATIVGEVCQPVEWRKSCMFSGGKTNYFTSFTVAPVEISFNNNSISNFSEKALCSVVSQKTIPLKPGDIFSVGGSLEKLKHASNPGEFDYAEYYKRKNINYKFSAKTGKLRWYTPEKLSFITKIKRFLAHAKIQFSKALSSGSKFQTEKAVLQRMLIGTKDPLPPELLETFKRTNTFHIIAISGLHIGIVCGIFWCLIWLAGIPGKYRAASILIFLWLYAAMVGLKPSVVRASLMFSGLAVAPLFNRRNHIINTLLFVALIYIIIWPRELTSLGSMLTFISVLALLIGMPLFNSILRRFKKIHPPEIYDLEHRKYRPLYLIFHYFLHIVSGTFVIWLFTWPIILTTNNLLTPSTWLANLFAIPALSLVLFLGFATLFFSFALSFAAKLINLFNLACLHFLIKSINLIGTFPGSFFSMKSLSAGSLFLYYISLAATLIWIWKYFSPAEKDALNARRLGFACFAGWILFACTFIKPKNNNPFELTILDVGLGDAMVIHSPENKNILIDGGVRFGSFSMGERVVVPYLRSAGINSLDAVICSHFDRDHVGGLIEILENIKVRKIYSPPEISLNPLAAKLKKIARRKNIEWREPFAGQKLFFGGLTGTVLNPPDVITNWNNEAKELNDNTWSLVIRWECGGNSFLATGDATTTSESLQMHAFSDLRSGVLKAGHHGSKTSSSEKYIDAVKPVLTIFNVGPNSLGLPSRRVINRFRERDIPVFRTDKSGAIKFIFGKKEIEVKTFLP